MGHGKDTVAAIINQLTGNKFQIERFSKKLKLVASIMTGFPAEKFEDQEFKKMTMDQQWDWIVQYTNSGVGGAAVLTRGAVKPGMEDRRKHYTIREFLQRLGTEAIRNGIHENAWVNALFADYKCPCNNCRPVECNQMPSWIIPDVRFPNEYDAVKQHGGIVIRVTRPDGALMDHPSEVSLDGHSFDYTINNNGNLLDLKIKVQNILWDLGYETIGNDN